MDYDDNDSQGNNLAGGGNSKSSPVSRPFSLPNFDFEDSLPSHLRFESLVENEVFLGISSQEDSQWIEDFSRGNSGIEFSTSATEPCSISRRNNVWSEAASSESVAMLLKSVGQEERIQGETSVLESDTGNELGRLTTEMEPNLKQDDKLEDITNSQPTASPDSFLDGMNVNAIEKDNLPVDGSSGVVPNVSIVIMSEADVGFDDINQLEVSNIEQPQVNNLEGLPPEIHVQNVTSMLPSNVAGSNHLNGQENEHRVSNAFSEIADGLLKDIPQRIMAEQNICRTESSGTGSATCTPDVECPHRVVSNLDSLEQHKDETNITSINEPSKLQENVTCDLTIKEACKVDKGSTVPSQLGNVEVGACNKGENICKPLQNSVCDSSVACLDDHTFAVVNKDAGNSACSGVEISIVEEKENYCGDQANRLESENLEVVDIKTGNSSCSDHDTDSIVESEKSENHMSGVVVSEASSLPDIDHRLAEQGEGNVRNPEISQSCTVSGSQSEKQLSSKDLSDIKTSIVLEDINTPEAQNSSIVVGGHVQLSKSNLSSEQEDVHSFGKDVSSYERENAKSPTACLAGRHVQLSKSNLSSEKEDVHSFVKDVSSHEREDAKLPTASVCPDEFAKANLVHGSEFLNSTSTGPGSKDTEEMDLSLCDTPIDSPLLSGSKTAADGVTLCEHIGSKDTVEMDLSLCDTPIDSPLLSGSKTAPDGVTLCGQEQNSQVANSLGMTNSPKVATDTKPFVFPEIGRASQIEQEAGPGCSTVVKACPVLNRVDVKLVDDTAPAARESIEEVLMERSAKVAFHVATDEVLLSSQTVVPTESVSVSIVESCNMIQKNHEVIVTSGTQSTESLSTKVESQETNQASVGLACLSECLADSVNKDGDASANLVEENVFPPYVISCVKTPPSENELQMRTKEVSIGSVQQHDSSNIGESSSLEVSFSTGLSEGETIKDLPLYPVVQVHKESTDVKECPSEENPGPPSVVSCANIPLSETRQKSGAKDASVATYQHSEGTPDAGGKVQSAALHMQHDYLNEGKIISIEVSSSLGGSESRIVKGSPSCPSIPVNKMSTDVEGYPLASDCSRRDHTVVPEHSHENSEVPGPMSGKKRASTRGTSERKTRQGSAKTSARANAKKRGVQETLVKQFEGDKSMMILNSPATSIAERSGIKACGAPTPMSNTPDLNNSVTPAYLQQPFTDSQQVQLRAQILVHGSLMQNSVPDEAFMISAFGPLDGGGCLWEPAWRACSERIHTQKSHASNLETPVQSRSGSRGPEHPFKNSSLQSNTHLPASGASSNGIPSPVVNPIMPPSSPLWNVTTPSCDGLQSSGTFVDFHQPFAPLQPYQSQGTKSFVEQSPSWLSQTHFPGQWTATTQNSALNVSADVSSMFCTESVTVSPAKVSSVPNYPAMKHPTGGGGASVSYGTPSQTDVSKVSIPSGLNSRDTKHKKRKKVSDSISPPGHMPSVTLDHAASVTDTSNHPSKKATAPQGSSLAQGLTETGSPVVNNVSSTPNAATATLFASTSHSGNYIAAVSPLILSDQSTKVDQIVKNKSRISEETLNEVEAAKVQAEDAAAHAAAAVGNCNDVWSQLSKLKNSGLRFADESKLSSAAMAIAAAASVAKAAAAAAKLASNVAIGAKLMADEVSTTSIAENNTYSTEISLSHSSNTSLLAGEGNVSARSIIAAAKETVKKRVDAATAASKHAENLDAMVKAAELAAEAVSQAGKIVSIGDPLPLSELVSSGPMDYWRTPQVSPEQGEKERFGQRDTFNPDKLVQAEPPKDGAIIVGEAVNPGTVTSIEKNSSTTQRGHSGGTNFEAITSRDAHRIAQGTSLENGMVEGCPVEVFKEGGNFKAAWYAAKISSLKDGKACVCYTELHADDGSGKLKEWVPLKGDGLNAPTIRIPHPTTSMCIDRTRKRRRAAVMDYTWCVGDRVDAWMQDCWFEGVVKEKNKNDETTLTLYIPALGGTSAVKTWHLRPTVTWQDGKWIEWPTAIQQSPTQGDTPQEKRVKLGHPAVEAAKEGEITKDTDLVKSKDREESRTLPLSANETEFNIGNNTGDIKLDAPRTARTGLQKEGSRVVFGVPKPGKKRKFMDVSKHLDSDRSSKNTKTSDSVKTARNLPQGPGGCSWNNNNNVNIKEKQAAADKPKVYRSGKPQNVSGGVLPQKINSSVSAKSTGKSVSRDENNSGQQNLMEFGTVSDSQDTSEGPNSSKGLSKVPRRRVPSSKTKSVPLNKGNRAASSGEFGKKVEQDKSFPHVSEPRRSNRKIQPTSRLLEGLQSSLIGSKIPSIPHEKNQRNLNKGDNSSHG